MKFDEIIEDIQEITEDDIYVILAYEIEKDHKLRIEDLLNFFTSMMEILKMEI